MMFYYPFQRRYPLFRLTDSMKLIVDISGAVDVAEDEDRPYISSSQ